MTSYIKINELVNKLKNKRIRKKTWDDNFYLTNNYFICNGEFHIIEHNNSIVLQGKYYINNEICQRDIADSFMDTIESFKENWYILDVENNNCKHSNKYLNKFGNLQFWFCKDCKQEIKE